MYEARVAPGFRGRIFTETAGRVTCSYTFERGPDEPTDFAPGIVSRLRAPGSPLDEGFDVELRGALGGAYGLTVGDMARVDVYVPGDQIEEASMVLLVTEVDDVDDDFDDDRPPRASRGRSVARLAAALVLFVLVAGPVAQVLRWY